MAHGIARAGAALASAAVLMLPTAAFGDSAHDHASRSADPHAGHADHGSAGDEGHADHGDPPPSRQAHNDAVHRHGESTDDGGHDNHGATTDNGAGHTDHGTQPDEVSPEVRNLVLSGFAGVNAAVIFGAWMVRRTGPDPDPRKRAPKASR